MTTLPLADGARLLGIHPKTLCHWLKEAGVPVSLHPTDGRIKCVTLEQIQQLAARHDRPLPSAATTRPVVSQAHVPCPSEHEAEPLQAARNLPTSFPQEMDVIQQLSLLESRVATLQEQLTQLALALLQERERTSERRMAALEITLQELTGRSTGLLPLADRQAAGTGKEPPEKLPRQPLAHPAEQRTRPLLPLIEYGATGTYVVICPDRGELPLLPDSTQWFEWLASLSSFRFIGKLGRLSASRVCDHGPKRTWYAYRCIHQRTYKHYLGTTDRLTIDVLEQMAAKLQSYLVSL